METGELNRYLVRNRNGWELESFNELADALDCIDNYERMDIYEEAYEPGFYEIYDNEKGKIIWP